MTGRQTRPRIRGSTPARCSVPFACAALAGRRAAPRHLVEGLQQFLESVLAAGDPLRVPSSRMASAVRGSFASIASISVVNRPASSLSKSLLAVKTQWLNAGETQMAFSPLTWSG